jgi:peroxiredoxin
MLSKLKLRSKLRPFHHFLIGEKIPGLTLVSVTGETTNLAALFKSKPTVLIFYRGGWCPYCNQQLAELQGIESQILSAGYQIVAISPDAPDNLRESLDKHELKYTLLSDNESKLAIQVGIAFQAPERYENLLIKASAGKNKNTLPVPSVFVVNQEGEILFEHINPDYKQRKPPWKAK